MYIHVINQFVVWLKIQFSSGPDAFGDSIIITSNSTGTSVPIAILIGPKYMAEKMFQNSPHQVNLSTAPQ